jgi:thiol-disulfide isomerase/thioredoxin
MKNFFSQNKPIMYNKIPGIEIKQPLFFLFLFSLSLIIGTPVYAFIEPPQDGICSPDTETSKKCNDVSVKPDDKNPVPVSKKKNTPKTLQKPADAISKKETGNETVKPSGDLKEVVVYFFRGKGCPHCEEEKLFLNELKKKYPDMKIIDYEVWYNKQNAALLAKMAKAYNMKASGVPVTFIGENAFIGFSKHSKDEISDSINQCLSLGCIDPSLVAAGKIVVDKNHGMPFTGPEKKEELECKEKSRTVYIPWVGNLDASEMSLPVMTIVIAGLDSFNPCAFFILFSLLGLLIHAQSRRKILLIGSVFVFFSAFIYFIFMAAWLNLFLVMGKVEIITIIAGFVAVLIAAINIKDFFIFKKGVSLTIPDSAKPKLFDRMRKLLKSTSLVSILAGTAVLAIAANAYELLCTAGFPMVFTRILTLNKLSSLSYYLYLILYNLIYVIPLSIIVVIFTVTLGKKHLTESQGRTMKLISGAMMLGLGGVLIFNPSILSNALISFLLLAGALCVSAIIIFLTKKISHS